MTETAFHEQVDAVLATIEALFDDSDVDCDLSAGILTLSFVDGSKVIINRQTANREIWVAAKSGGFHFQLVESQSVRKFWWRDTRSGEPLATLLSRVISAQSGEEISIAL